MRNIASHSLGSKATSCFNPSAQPSDQFKGPLEARIVKLEQLRDRCALTELEFEDAKK